MMSIPSDKTALVAAEKEAKQYFNLIRDMLQDTFSGSSDITKLFIEAARNQPSLDDIIDSLSPDIQAQIAQKKDVSIAELIITPFQNGMDKINENPDKIDAHAFAGGLRKMIVVSLKKYEVYITLLQEHPVDEQTKNNALKKVDMLKSLDTIAKQFYTDKELSDELGIYDEDEEEDEKEAKESAERSLTSSQTLIERTNTDKMSRSSIMTGSTVAQDFISQSPEAQAIQKEIEEHYFKGYSRADLSNIVNALALALRESSSTKSHVVTDFYTFANALNPVQKKSLVKTLSAYSTEGTLLLLKTIKEQPVQNNARLRKLFKEAQKKYFSDNFDPIIIKYFLDKFERISHDGQVHFTKLFFDKLSSTDRGWLLEIFDKIDTNQIAIIDVLSTLLDNAEPQQETSSVIALLYYIIGHEDEFEEEIENLNDLFPESFKNPVSNLDAGKQFVSLLASLCEFQSMLIDIQYAESHAKDHGEDLLAQENRIKTISENLRKFERAAKASLENNKLQRFLKENDVFAGALAKLVGRIFKSETTIELNNFSHFNAEMEKIDQRLAVVRQTLSDQKAKSKSVITEKDDGKSKRSSEKRYAAFDRAMARAARAQSGKGDVHKQSLALPTSQSPLPSPISSPTFSHKPKAYGMISAVEDQKTKDELRRLREELSNTKLALQKAESTSAQHQRESEQMRTETVQHRTALEASKEEARQNQMALRQALEDAKRREEGLVQERNSMVEKDARLAGELEAAKERLKTEQNHFAEALTRKEEELNTARAETKRRYDALMAAERAREIAERQVENRQADLVAANKTHEMRVTALHADMEREHRAREAAERQADARQVALNEAIAARNTAQQQAAERQVRIDGLQGQLANEQAAHGVTQANLAAARARIPVLEAELRQAQADLAAPPGRPRRRL